MEPNASRPHILLVAPQPFYEDRGTPIAIRHVVTALSQLGWKVDLLTYSIGEDLELPGMQIYRFGRWYRFKSVPIGLSFKKILLDVLLPWAIASRMLRTKYTCIHAVEEAVYPSLLLGRLGRVPVIYDMQSSIAEQLALNPYLRFARLGRPAAWLERIACREADAVVCSAGLADKLMRRPPLRPPHEWIFPGHAASETGTDGALAADEIGLDGTKKVVIYTGNFQRYQGIAVLMAAVPLVLESYPNVVFLLIGADPRELRRLSSTFADLVKTGRVMIWPRLSRRKVCDLLKVATIGISPRIEGSNFPLKVFDYLAAGLPVVASDITAHRHAAVGHLLLVRPTPLGVAEGVLRFLRDEELSRDYQIRALEFADTAYSSPKFREQVQDLYRGVIGPDTTGLAED